MTRYCPSLLPALALIALPFAAGPAASAQEESPAMTMTYADLADLSDGAGLVLRAQVRKQAEREAALREVEAQARAEATVETERRLGRRGRADALFYASAALSIGALGGGSLLGFYALRKDNVADDWVVGRGHSASARAAEQASARRMAIGADLLLGTGIAAGVSALLLYYLRDRHPPDGSQTALRLSLTPSLSGATLWVGGRL